MNPRNLISSLLFLVALTVSAQFDGYDRYWYFGVESGIDFGSGSPVPSSGSKLGALLEGCVTVSDSSGQLLFYGSGVQVFNRTHNVMQDGSGLKGSISTSMMDVVQVPCTAHEYYYIAGAITSGSLKYSVIDMSLNGGLGGVDPSRKNVVIRNETDELLLIIRKSPSVDDYWMISHFGDEFFVDEINANGITLNTPQKIGGITGNQIHCMEYSEQLGKMVVVGYNGERIDILDFDISTGQLSNYVAINDNNHVADKHAYGDFSADGTKFYFCGFGGMQIPGGPWTTHTFVLQLDLTNGNLITALDTIPGIGYEQPRLGPDGKMYVISRHRDSLAVINFPDLPGASCGFIRNGFYLGGAPAVGSNGLPKTGFHSVQGSDQAPDIQFLSVDTPGCGIPATVLFDPENNLIVNYLWDFDDGKTDTVPTPLHTFDTTGAYEVSLVATGKCFVDTFYQTINVFVGPTVTMGDSVTIDCGRFGGVSATVTATVSGGAAPYTYAWNTDPPETGAEVTGLRDGTHTVTVWDNKGCMVRDSITIDPYITVAVTIDKDPSCLSCPDGEVSVVPTGGTAPYTYRWSDFNEQTTATATGLTAGSYTLVVTDSDGCWEQIEVILDAPDGVNQRDFGQIKLFPNPGEGYYYIESSSVEMTGYRVSDLSGRNIISAITRATKFELDISAFPNGIYVVQITSEKGPVIRRLIKN